MDPLSISEVLALTRGPSNRGTTVASNALVKACLEYLHLRGIFAWRVNNTPIYDEKRKRFRAMNSVKGVPDIIGICHGGRWIGVEAKAGPNAKLSPDQREFRRRVEEAGGLYIVARSVADLEGVI